MPTPRAGQILGCTDLGRQSQFHAGQLPYHSRLPEYEEAVEGSAKASLTPEPENQVKNETVFKRHFAVAGYLRAPGLVYCTYIPRVRRDSRGERKG